MLGGLLVGGLGAVVGLAVWAVTATKPAKATVEKRLTDRLPRGYVLFSVSDYDRETGWVKFFVTYPDDDPMGVRYDVERTRTHGEGTYDRPVWNVRVTCRRSGPDGLTFLDAVFDRDGVMNRVRPTSGPARALERLYEEPARRIARVVFETL